LSYIAELFIAPVQWRSIGLHLFSPQLPDAQALSIAVGIIGATVMPHALFLHSGLTQNRLPVATEAERRKLLKFSNAEVIIALTVAGMINVAMVIMAAGAFHSGHPDVAEIQAAYHTLTPLLGIAAAGVFLVSLIASGISSSVVGTMAGQMVMQGFVGFRISLWLRRAITMVPAFIVVALGVNATQALVVSQIVLSFALPVPMAALVWFTCRKGVMGDYHNRLFIKLASILAATLVLSLNIVLLLQTFGLEVPGLPAN
jgi:manganese transport protein